MYREYREDRGRAGTAGPASCMTVRERQWRQWYSASYMAIVIRIKVIRRRRRDLPELLQVNDHPPILLTPPSLNTPGQGACSCRRAGRPGAGSCCCVARW